MPEERNTKPKGDVPMKTVKKIEAMLEEYYETFKH